VPFIYGGGVAIMDMRTMGVSYASPEFLINMAALCDLGRYYQLPVFSFGACSDSKLFDQQAALEGALWTMVTTLAGGNMSHDVGYIDSGLTSSMEMTVMGDEVIGMVRRFVRGIEINDDTMALDVIDRVGPGGHFLGDEHTRLHHRRSNWLPTLIDRNNHDTWRTMGAQSYGERANARARELVETHQPLPLPEEIRAAVRAIVERADARHGLG
jgi:trimethylamine--corrinoid protein Co-methyltransferase